MTDPLAFFASFVDHVRRKLEAGRAFEAATPAVERPTLDLIGEIQDELADMCRWSDCLWARLEYPKARAAVVDAPRPRRAGMVGAERAR